MPIQRLRVAGYRSVRQLSLELGPMNVIVGANGSGKTNLYRALYLLAAAAEGWLARTLCLLAALLSPRPPAFLALNGPETSLHPDLMEPLGRLIHNAARYSQVWVTTHSEPLARGLTRASRCEPMYLVKQEGATRVEGGPDEERE